MSLQPDRSNLRLTRLDNPKEIKREHSQPREPTNYPAIVESLLKKPLGQDFNKILQPALEWLRATTQNEKKGLKIINLVVQNKGSKTFKPLEKKPEVKELLDLRKFNFKDAMKEYQKLKYKSSYGSFYGRKPALEDLTDITILNSQQFSQLPCTKILTKSARIALDLWQKIEPEAIYKGLALSTLRSLNTYILKSEPTISSSRIFHRRFKPAELNKVERYDKLIEKISMSVKKKFQIERKANKGCKRITVPRQGNHCPAKAVDLDIFGRTFSRKRYLRSLRGSISTLNNGQPMVFNNSMTTIINSASKQSSLARSQNYGSLFKISVGGGACIPDTRYKTIESCKQLSIAKDLEKIQNSMTNTINKNLPKTKQGYYSKSDLRKGLSIEY
ncbi:unnamed protein product [Moneuplotes crassus]|uniref:Uncharacterized protein n=1 Tax=Euplotes crassus TaxID=5936 RepID=A0AAD1UB42_EUPCR|nr:unnamed protein product [Moneuplotes crassus]